MKKILFIVHNLKFGGIQKITLELARNHVMRGNEVHIICLEKGKSIDVDFDCHLHTINLVSFLMRHPLHAIYYAFYKILFRYLIPRVEIFFAKPIFKPQINALINKLEATGKFDAIFIRGIRSVNRTWWLERDDVVRSLHMPTQLLTKQKTFLSNYHRWVSTCLFKGKTYFAVSDYIAKPLINNLATHDIHPKNFEIINNPCDIKRVIELSQEDVNVLDGKYILGVGRLTKQKRFDLLIKAFHKANPKGHKLVILGEGNQREALEKLINNLGIEDLVIMPGFINNPYPWYKKAKLFVLSSDNEGFVNVITEALACGVPVISTDCGPAYEILKGKLSAGISPKGDFIKLSNKINAYIDNPVIPTRKDIEWLSFENIISQQMQLVESNLNN